MFEELKNIIVEYVTVKVEEITLESKLVEDLGLNSYEFMSLVGRIEEEYDIEVDEREVVKIKTVGEVIDYINTLKK